jgi:WD40 repeat protein
MTGAVEIWDAASGQKLQNIPAHKLAIMKLIVSRDGRRLVTVGQDNNPMMVQGQPGVMISNPRVSVWDTSTWKLESSVAFSSTAGGDAEISADGKFLTVSKGGGITQLFDLQKKSTLAVLAPPLGRAGSLAFSPDGTLLVQGAQEGVRIWKVLISQPPLN